MGEEAEAGFAIGVAREGSLAVVARGVSQYPGGPRRFLRAWVVLVPTVYSWVYGGEKSVLVTAGQAGWRWYLILFAEKLREMHAGRFLRR